MVPILKGHETWPLEIWTNGIFKQNPFEIQKKYLDLEKNSFQMVGTIAIALVTTWLFEDWTFWNPTFIKSWFQMFRDY